MALPFTLDVRRDAVEEVRAFVKGAPGARLLHHGVATHAQLGNGDVYAFEDFLAFVQRHARPGLKTCLAVPMKTIEFITLLCYDKGKDVNTILQINSSGKDYALNFSSKPEAESLNRVLKFVDAHNKGQLTQIEENILKSRGGVIDQFVVNYIKRALIHEEAGNYFFIPTVAQPNISTEMPLQSVLSSFTCTANINGVQYAKGILYITQDRLFFLAANKATKQSIAFQNIITIFTAKDQLHLKISATARWTFPAKDEALFTQVTLAFCSFVARHVQESYFPNAIPRDGIDVVSELSYFNDIDVDHDGSIQRPEFYKCLGTMFKKELADALFGVFDINKDSVISFVEYARGMCVLVDNQEDLEKDKVDFSFKLFDTDNNGSIDRQEFFLLTELISGTMRIPLAKAETLKSFSNKLFDSIDRECKGYITYDDYKRSVQNEEMSKLFPILWGGKHGMKRVAKGRQVLFGDPNWNNIMRILAGITLATLKADESKEPPAGFLSKYEFVRKDKFNLTRSQVVGGEHVATPWGTDHPKTEVCFTDYCPQVFRRIRRISGISTNDYLWSLGLDHLISSMLLGSITAPTSLSSSGRSGAFFVGSHDGNYLVKTIHQDESVALRAILEDYVRHLDRNPNTLLTKYYGLHALQSNGRKTVFVVMGSVFMADKSIQVTYDLKGSTAGRSVPQDQRGGGVSLKDLDFNHERKSISLETDMKRQLLEQLRTDSEFLEKGHLIDYSLLLGMHLHDTAERARRKTVYKKKEDPDDRETHAPIAAPLQVVKFEAQRFNLAKYNITVCNLDSDDDDINTIIDGLDAAELEEYMPSRHTETDIFNDPIYLPQPRDREPSVTYDGHDSLMSMSGKSVSFGDTVFDGLGDTDSDEEDEEDEESEEELEELERTSTVRSDTTEVDPYQKKKKKRRSRKRKKKKKVDMGLLFNEAQRKRSQSLYVRKHLGDTPQSNKEDVVRARNVFQQHYGGIKAKDSDEIYFVGIIDILTTFRMKKEAEYRFKKATTRGGGMSCVPPPQYKDRFINYFQSIIR